MDTENKKSYDYIRLGKRIQARRKEIGLTQEELSEKIDCSLTHLSRLESGSPPGLDTLIRLSYLLGYSLDEMVGLYPSPSPVVHEICDLFLVHTEEEQKQALLLMQYFFYVLDQKEENFKIRKRKTKSTEITVNQLMEALPNTQPEEFIKQFTDAFADLSPKPSRKFKSKNKPKPFSENAESSLKAALASSDPDPAPDSSLYSPPDIEPLHAAEDPADDPLN